MLAMASPLSTRMVLASLTTMIKSHLNSKEAVDLTRVQMVCTKMCFLLFTGVAT